MKTAAVVALSIFLFSCKPSYLLTLKMQPSTNAPGSAVYENDTLKLKFTITDTYLGVRLDNKTNKGIKINWDEVSFSLNGKTYARVLHNLKGRKKINDSQPATSIPPRSFIDDKVYPREKMYTSVSGSYYFSSQHFFFRPKKANESSDQYQQSKKGNKIVIHLPYYIETNFAENNFDIEIVDVKKKKKKNCDCPATATIGPDINKNDKYGAPCLSFTVTRPGFEPRQAEPESAVLPLYYRAMKMKSQN